MVTYGITQWIGWTERLYLLAISILFASFNIYGVILSVVYILWLGHPKKSKAYFRLLDNIIFFAIVAKEKDKAKKAVQFIHQGIERHLTQKHITGAVIFILEGKEEYVLNND